jgi:putative transposase
VRQGFAALRLLPMSDRDKDVEILALRHQITVLEHQLGAADTRVGWAMRWKAPLNAFQIAFEDHLCRVKTQPRWL